MNGQMPNSKRYEESLKKSLRLFCRANFRREMDLAGLSNYAKNNKTLYELTEEERKRFL